ncbi:MAG: 4Fe-4S dicluster domain-containing protein [Anaerolineales bacterium]|nr:4Fe-4S dicluster domain-containing protein [Anaerolineales bacterium]
MSLSILPKSALPEWIERLAESYRLIGPRLEQGQYVFDELRSASELHLDYPTSVLPPKKALLPQREDLFHWQYTTSLDKQQSSFQVMLDERPSVVLGVHNCDLHAIHLLDQAFNRGYPDQHYRARRENTLFVGLECLSPCTEQAFCKDMGTLSMPEDFDLHLTDLGDDYAVYVGSQKGAALLNAIDPLRQPSEQERQRLGQVMSNKWSRFPFRLQADLSELPGLLSISYKSSLWEELGRQCLACGMCTIVCPTCYCFDLLDEVDLSLSSGSRYRVWDSCQLNQFAAIAGGHNFRSQHSARQRHRFLRKYKYQSLAPGLLGCVGCGRCASTCPVNISPVEVLNKLHQSRVASTHKGQEALL